MQTSFFPFFFFFLQASLSKCDCHLHMTAKTEKNVDFSVLYSCQTLKAAVCVTGCSCGAVTNEPEGSEIDN